ncbi:MAG: cytochrome c maturation protein CcmE [Burkholderiaceae bacterium]
MWVLAGVAALAAAAALVFNALGSNLSMFITPSDVVAGKAPAGRTFRIGGLVEPGSLKRDADKVGGSFVVTDNAHSVRVAYSGILPDLFKEGRGVVAQGRLANDGSFVASEVLAKHDENYMPPEAAEALKRAGHPVGTPEQFREPAKGVGAARGN